MDLQDLRDLRAEVRTALKKKTLDSFVESLKFLLGSVTVCGVVGGGLRVLGSFSAETMTGLAVTAVVMWLCSFLLLDRKRLQDHSRLLSELSAIDRNYEALLTEARAERDESGSRAMALMTQLEIVRQVKSLLPVQGEGSPAARDAKEKL
jgi:ABC-type protease/lipase transport system fused ATPase/permease subunit